MLGSVQLLRMLVLRMWASSLELKQHIFLVRTRNRHLKLPELHACLTVRCNEILIDNKGSVHTDEILIAKGFRKSRKGLPNKVSLRGSVDFDVDVISFG